MTEIIYTAKASVTGGREGSGRTEDGAFEVQLRRPGQLGNGSGANPEQLFAIGYGACFTSAVGHVARRGKQRVGEVAVDISVSLLSEGTGPYRLEVEMDVRIGGLAEDQSAADIVAEADRICPYSNAIRGNVAVRIVANGKPLAGSA